MIANALPSLPFSSSLNTFKSTASPQSSDLKQYEKNERNNVEAQQKNNSSKNTLLVMGILGGVFALGTTVVLLKMRKSLVKPNPQNFEPDIKWNGTSQPSPPPDRTSDFKSHKEDSSRVRDINNSPSSPKITWAVNIRDRIRDALFSKRTPSKNLQAEIKWQDITDLHSPLEKKMKEISQICQSVMKAGNEGVSCHTMATLNALRLYNHITPHKTPEVQKRLDAILRGTPREAKNRAFRFFKEAMPNGWGNTITSDGCFPDHSKFATTLVPHFLSRYAFDQVSYTAHTFVGVVGHDIAQILEGLAEGHVGTLIGSPWRGTHVVSLVGIHENKEGELRQAIDLLKSSADLSEYRHSLQDVKILIYDQLNPNPTVEALPLNELLQENNQFFFHLFKNPYQPSEKWEKMYDNSSANFLSPTFHTRFMQIGDRIFNES
jgi:hypothetical protein